MIIEVAFILIFIIWIISLILGVVSFLFWKFGDEDWAEVSLIICIIIFVGIPLIILVGLLLGIANAGLEWYNQLLKNIIG